MYHFCTIASPDFVPFVQVLHASLRRQDSNVQLHVLFTGENTDLETEGIITYNFNHLQKNPHTAELLSQYTGNNLRWAAKPLFLLWLLQSLDKVIYVDNDIHFFGPYSFLFHQLENHSLVLTPHWCSQQPLPQEESFMMNFQTGLYNAGFIGASKKARNVLTWWLAACLYKMEINTANGFFVDQRYLDLAPIVDEQIGIVRHEGCNIGSWNMHQNKRAWVDGEILINGKYPVVFIHFNHETITHILNGNDKLLQPFFKRYEDTFLQTGIQLKDLLPSLTQWKKAGPLLVLARSTKIRTRVKNWLFRLSQKL